MWNTLNSCCTSLPTRFRSLFFSFRALISNLRSRKVVEKKIIWCELSEKVKMNCGRRSPGNLNFFFNTFSHYDFFFLGKAPQTFWIINVFSEVKCVCALQLHEHVLESTTIPPEHALLFQSFASLIAVYLLSVKAWEKSWSLLNYC